MGSKSTSSFALGSDVSLGSLTLDLEKGEVVIPAATIADSLATADSQISASDLHDKTYTMSCADSTDSECASFVAESPQVFFRHLTATEGGASVEGFAVWASQDAFTACGSVDFSSDEIGGDVTFTKGTEGSYSTDATACELRSEYNPDTQAEVTTTPRAKYAMQKVVAHGLGFSFGGEDTFHRTDTCTAIERFNIDFAGTPSKLVGMFNFSTFFEGTGCSENDLSDEGTRAFPVIFTVQ